MSVNSGNCNNSVAPIQQHRGKKKLNASNETVSLNYPLKKKKTTTKHLTSKHPDFLSLTFCFLKVSL